MKKTKMIILLVTLVFFLICINIVPNFVSGITIDQEVELNNGIIHREEMFNNLLLAPSQIVTSNEIYIKNTGSVSLNMYEKFYISLKRDLSDGKLNEMLDKYFVKVYLKKNGEILNSNLSESWISATEFNSYFNEEKGRDLGTINPNDTLSIIIKVKLDENAGNEYQGVLLNINFIAAGLMSITDNGLLLPDTATSSFNLILIGIILIGCGITVSYVYKRRISDVRK